MAGKVTDLFAIPIYEVEYPNFEEIYPHLMEFVKGHFKDGFTSDYEGHEHPVMEGSIIKIYDVLSPDEKYNSFQNEHVAKLAEFITNSCKEYWNILNLSDMLEPHILHLWAGVQRKGARTVSHNHNPIPIGGVFYLEARPEQGNLLLENPLDLLIGKTPTNKNNNKTPTRFYHEIETYSGKLVLFPGWMKHYTKGNPTDDLRIAIAVNFGCHGQVYHTEFG